MPTREELNALSNWAQRRMVALAGSGEPARPAPSVSVPVTVMPAPIPSYDWLHTHVYDNQGRLVKTVSTRVQKTAAASTE